jgi:predicted ester cyclase
MKRRGAIVAAALAADVLIRTPAQAQDADAAHSLVERFAATLTAHDMTGFAALFADSYQNHQASAAAPAPTNLSPKQATVRFFAARLAGIPDLKVSIEVVVAAVDKVAASFVYSGTHGGPYFGFAPTGKALRFTSCDIYAVRDGAFVEHWGMGDIAGVMAQLKA